MVQAILRSRVWINGTLIQQTVCLFPESHGALPPLLLHLSTISGSSLDFLHAKGQRETLRGGAKENKSSINTTTLLLFLCWYLSTPFFIKRTQDINLSTCIYFSRKNRTSVSQESRVASEALKSFSARSLCRFLTWKYNVSNQVQLQINNDHARCHPAPIIRTRAFMCLPVFGPVTSRGHGSLCSATFSTQKFIGPL